MSNAENIQTLLMSNLLFVFASDLFFSPKT